MHLATVPRVDSLTNEDFLEHYVKVQFTDNQMIISLKQSSRAFLNSSLAETLLILYAEKSIKIEVLVDNYVYMAETSLQEFYDNPEIRIDRNNETSDNS